MLAAIAAAFLLGFPALFSIVNPVSGAFIFRTRVVERSHDERVRLARRVALYAALVMLVALWAGSYVLAFFGITLPRCAARRRYRAGAVCLELVERAGTAGGAQGRAVGRGGRAG